LQQWDLRPGDLTCSAYRRARLGLARSSGMAETLKARQRTEPAWLYLSAASVAITPPADILRPSSRLSLKARESILDRISHLHADRLDARSAIAMKLAPVVTTDELETLPQPWALCKTCLE